jgi:hypothetical protein
MLKEEVILLLKGADCKTCQINQRDDECVRWLGEAVGWQWWPRDKRGFCEDYKQT